MQTKRGNTPMGFCAMEYQEYMRCRVLPAIDRWALAAFRPHANEWFDEAAEKSYEALKRGSGYRRGRQRPCCLIAVDQAPTHTWTDMPWFIAHEEERDRRTIKPRAAGWVDLDKESDFMPTAPKVPDTLQQPIEMIFGIVKTRFRSLMAERSGSVNWRTMYEDFHRAWVEKVNPSLCERCFQHALTAIKIWMTPRDQLVTITDAHNQVEVHGTGGGWVPKKYRG